MVGWVTGGRGGRGRLLLDWTEIMGACLLQAGSVQSGLVTNQGKEGRA